MKQKMFVVLIGIFLCSILVGCGQKDSEEIKATLNDTYDKIGEYFDNDKVDRSNLGAYYLDSQQNKVVVVLIDNNKKMQEEFVKNANVNAEYIIFVQGGPYTTSIK